MRAIVYGGPGRFDLCTVPDPRPEPGGLVARVEACGVCGTDYKLFFTENPRFPPGSILGHEFVATVVETGGEASDFCIGDRVTMATTVPCGACELCGRGLPNLCPSARCVGAAYQGAFAELIPIAAHAIRMGNVLKVPNGLSSAAATLTEPLSCVINAQEIARVGQGNSVAVVGAGPLGCMHVQVARARGAGPVFAVQRSKARCELAARFGPDAVICSEAEDPVDRIKALTGGRGADRVLVCAPDRAAQEMSIHLAAKGGVVSLFASLPKGASDITLDSRVVHYGQLAVVGCSDSTAAQAAEALRMLASGAVDAARLITHEFPLERILDGIEVMRQKTCLKVLVRVSGAAAHTRCG